MNIEALTRQVMIDFEVAVPDIPVDFGQPCNREPRRVVITASTVEQAKRFKRGAVINIDYADRRLPVRVTGRRGVRVFLREVVE